MTRLIIIFALILSITGALSACSATTTPMPTVIPVPTQTANPSPTYTLIPTVTMEPTNTLVPVPKLFWPTTTDEGNQIIQKILSTLSSAGIQIVDEASFTDATDTNTLLGRPHQYIAKAVWRDPSIAGGGEAGVDTGGTIEVFLNSTDLQTRYDYIDGITSSNAMFAEYHYQNPPAFIRLSKVYLPSQAQKIADIFLALNFEK
jgi:hypothetical protein